MWSSAEAGVASPAGFSKGCGMWWLLLQQMQEGSVAGRKLWRSPGPLEPPRWIWNPRYLRSLSPCARSLVPKFVVRVGFQACISLLSITEQPFPITSGGQFTVSHRKWSCLGSWLKKKKEELSSFSRSFCPLDTFSSFWPDKAYLSSGYEPIIQSWIEIYGHLFLPAHTRRLCDSRNCLCTEIKKTPKTEGEKKNPYAPQE